MKTLPESAAPYFLLGEGPGITVMTDLSCTLTLVAWAVVALVACACRLIVSDADH